MSRERCKEKNSYYFAEPNNIYVAYCDVNFGVDRDKSADLNLNAY